MKAVSPPRRVTLAERRVPLSPVETLVARALQGRAGGLFAQLVVEVRAFDGSLAETDTLDLPTGTLPAVAAALLEVQYEAYHPARNVAGRSDLSSA